MEASLPQERGHPGGTTQDDIGQHAGEQNHSEECHQMSPGMGLSTQHDDRRDGSRATEHWNGERDEGNIVFFHPFAHLFRRLDFTRSQRGAYASQCQK